ncbi:MAG: quinohemoprotein amine dehydrogenase subunit alpha [Colwellia sp.]|nr:quinohemoprotein amine dehydrogenase subunit alpha [Colwellia sp.]
MLKKTLFGILLILTTPLLFAESLDKDDSAGAKLIRANCLGCHVPTDKGLSRISEQRKTPEGWEMTINRMRLMHGLKINKGDLAIKGSGLHEIVKYLADNQGLAPSETHGVRYLLEQDLNQIETQFDDEFTTMCARCHSGARVALQRRDAKEWNYLIDFHLGQFPSTEYSLFGRDRNWLDIARNKMVPLLAKKYPFTSEDWSAWVVAQKPELEGKWILSGHMPGKGFFSATMKVTQNKKDYYSLSIEGNYATGEAIKGAGSSVVYTGYDWRGNINFGDISLRQTLAASADGQTLTGRFYQKGQELVGMKITAIKDTANTNTRLLSVFPSHIKKGQTTTLTITGLGLNSASANSLSLPASIMVNKVISQSANRIVVNVTAKDNAPIGYVDIQIGGAILTKQLAIYKQVNALEVVPSYGVSRVGDNGGSTPKTNTLFRAVGFDYGKDGIANTADDINLGYIEAVTWAVVPRDEIAKKDKDVQFAGQMNSNTGLFSPAAAGPNPERYRSTNNAGNLNVVAKLNENDEISGIGRLLVTLQRWNNPPLK